MNTFISIEDYQMNVTVVYSENPTSMAYSSNKHTVAMYPICIEYLNDGVLTKGAITFISDDKDHCHQQVQKFEERMMEILREKLNRPLTNWVRYSDGCKGQFKSGYCVADLFKATEKFNIKNATFNFFESHEGKSTSDTIGSIVKCAFIRATFKSEQGITDIDDILGLINSEIKPSTKKFNFFIAEKFGQFPKETSNSHNFCKVPGIMGLHSFKLCGDEISLLGLTCTECSKT